MNTPVGANHSWQRRSLRSVWHPCTQMQRAAVVPPLPLARGEGPCLIDHEGRRYFDATSSWWVNLFGHADARINAALKDQLDRLPHVMLAGCTHAPAVELAERLSALTGGVLGYCFFASDGASAVEIAVKMSFLTTGATPRDRTNGSLSACASATPARRRGPWRSRT